MAKDKGREKDPCRVQLKDVRLSHPHIFRPQAYGDGDGEPAYSANFLIPKDTKLGQRNIDLIEDAIEAAKDKKWGNKPPKIGRTKRFFKDGDDEDYRDKEENVNHMIATARNYRQPKLFDRDKTEVVEADDVLYAGCYVDAIITVWAQDNKFGQRINASLEAIRFRRDGEPFGAPPVDPDEFEDLDDEDDDDDDDRSSRRRRSRDDDDDDDDRPSRRRRSRDDDDDDDDDEDRPSRNRRDRRRRRDDDI